MARSSNKSPIDPKDNSEFKRVVKRMLETPPKSRKRATKETKSKGAKAK